MKKLFILLIVAIITALLMVSCENQDASGSGGKDDYYVKYSIKSGGPYLYFSDIVYADVYGSQTAEKGHSIKSWTVTIGPVKKGFRASVRNTKGTGNNIIEVSKNGGPFAQKATGTNGASYTINF